MQIKNTTSYNHSKLYIIISILIPFACLAIIRLSYFQSGENSFDSFYHIAISDAGPKVFMAKKFNYTTLSIWSNAFSDKEFLYHLILSGLRKCKSFFDFDAKYALTHL